jgi:antitoxin FitA
MRGFDKEKFLSLALRACYPNGKAQLVIENLEDDVRDRLQSLARDHDHSVEEEARGILREAVTSNLAAAPNLGSRMAACFTGLGLDHEIPELRGGRIELPSFDP